MSTFGAHGLSRTITLKFYQKMQNVIVINIQEKNRQYFLAIWPLAAIQKPKIAILVKFQNWRKLCKLYIKMKLLASAFQKSWFQGHSSSLKVKNHEKRVKFQYFLK